MSNVDWLELLSQCKDNVSKRIQPNLKNLKATQPELGTGAGGDQMKIVDLTAEKAIIEVFLQHEKSFTLVSEESGIIEYGAKPKECYLTLDPIDGTTNLMRGLPFYCSSMAVSSKPTLSDIHAALVADLVRGTIYTATKGGGASCDGEKISTSNLSSLDEAVIGLDLNTYKMKEIAPQVSELIQKTRHIRHFGANALELCFVAEGLTDAFVDVRGKLRATDVAASFLILNEAGGTITSPDGQPIDIALSPTEKLKFVASGNKQIHKAILSLIKPN